MELEAIVGLKLLERGFTKKQLLNNRGLIGATIDETILAVVKGTAHTFEACIETPEGWSLDRHLDFIREQKLNK